MESRDYTGVQSSAVLAGQYRFGPFVVDRARYRVLRGAEALELTPKLLDLLIHLVDHAGSLVTKEELLDALWPGANVTDNALAQAVSELREALGDNAGTPYFIKTVTRRGYRFIAPVETIKNAPQDSAPVATVTARSPAADLLHRAIDHARRAIDLDDTLAEAYATLALLLVSAWQTEEAVQAARRAVAREPSNWRHFFRLGHASWGDERLRAAHNTLTLYPDFAFAHFQMAMVHVASSIRQPAKVRCSIAKDCCS
jgi:DNA-binding winged helix-turn-helix (wHTH) protein